MCDYLRRMTRRAALFVLALLFTWHAAPSSVRGAVLGPEQIALVINANVPASRQLAEFYAKQRHIPAGRIISLSLPAPSPNNPPEDIAPDAYDRDVVPAVRKYLLDHKLDKKVKCLVTFWGVPLRIDRRAQTPAEAKEQADVKQQLATLRPTIERQVADAEALARQLNPNYEQPANLHVVDPLAVRGQAALNDVLRHLATMSDSAERTRTFYKMIEILRALVGQPTVTEKLSQPQFRRLSSNPPTAEQLADDRVHVAQLQKEVIDLEKSPEAAASRAKLRDLFKAELGTLNTERLLLAQDRILEVNESESAFDSELSLLWFGPYPKARWELNSMYWRYAGKVRPKATPLMVMRLDGPSERIVRDLIATSIRVEKQGLKGQAVIDARGKPPTEPYGVYDQTLRDLAKLLRAKTNLKVTLDDKEALIPAHSQKDIAIYCGWYSLRHYVPPGQFNPGAVAFHVASGEMISLHNPRETGWTPGLLNDGVAATLGPVAEPYLQSFPPADEFFPLLLTGKLPLAEVYWKTTPWVSWMQCCVGDPLYTPYKTNAPLKVADLPHELRDAVQ